MPIPAIVWGQRRRLADGQVVVVRRHSNNRLSRPHFRRHLSHRFYGLCNWSNITGVRWGQILWRNCAENFRSRKKMREDLFSNPQPPLNPFKDFCLSVCPCPTPWYFVCFFQIQGSLK